MDIKLIEVSNCYECPFLIRDNEYGCNECSLANQLQIPIDIESHKMSNDSVHELCPLKKSDYLFKLKKP